MTISEFVREVGPTVNPWEATTIDDVRRAVSDLSVYWPEQEFTQDEVADYVWQRCKERRAIYGKLGAGESRQHPELAVYYYMDGEVYLEFTAQEPEAWNDEEISRIIGQIEAALEEAK